MTEIIKVVKVGESVTTTDIRKMILSSENQMFKYHGEFTPTLTVNAGETNSYVEFDHGLSYVPAFLAYINSGGYNYLLPSFDISAYATNRKIRIQRISSTPWNYDILNWTAPNDLYDDRFGGRNYTVTGHKDGIGRNHAIKFNDASIDRGASIISASLDHYAEYRWVSSPPHDMKLKTYGIDEDNTGNFDSNPMGRTKTDAVTSQTQVVVGVGEFIGTNVKDQVQEIVNRSGWNPGNSLGFLVFDDNGPDGNAIEDDSGKHKLSITVNLGGSTSYNLRVIVFKDKLAA